MHLIQITENFFANADKIDSVESVVDVDGNKKFIVTVNSRAIFANRHPRELMSELIKSGSANLSEQFFAV